MTLPSPLTRSSLIAGATLIASGCCSGLDGDGITEAACDVVMAAGCTLPASQSECFERYIVRNQDCCGQEYVALMNCYAAATWSCEAGQAETSACDAQMSDLDVCEGEHPLCAHPPTGRMKSCD
jgi:hypothetical protein